LEERLVGSSRMEVESVVVDVIVVVVDVVDVAAELMQM
jgi:hypothetical protein